MIERCLTPGGIVSHCQRCMTDINVMEECDGWNSFMMLLSIPGSVSKSLVCHRQAFNELWKHPYQVTAIPWWPLCLKTLWWALTLGVMGEVYDRTSRRSSTWQQETIFFFNHEWDCDCSLCSVEFKRNVRRIMCIGYVCMFSFLSWSYYDRNLWELWKSDDTICSFIRHILYPVSVLLILPLILPYFYNISSIIHVNYAERRLWNCSLIDSAVNQLIISVVSTDNLSIK